jgi:hypothetical protein
LAETDALPVAADADVAGTELPDPEFPAAVLPEPEEAGVEEAEEEAEADTEADTDADGETAGATEEEDGAEDELIGVLEGAGGTLLLASARSSSMTSEDRKIDQ